MSAWKAKARKNVTVVLPNGAEEDWDSVSAEEVNDIALEAGLSSFEVKDADGNQLETENFPVTKGKVVISEYNEAKDC